MNKLLLMASMWMMILLPLRASRAKNPLSGLSTLVALCFALNVVWAVIMLAYFAAHAGDPESLLPPTVEP
jgi:hypothetical protein